MQTLRTLEDYITQSLVQQGLVDKADSSKAQEAIEVGFRDHAVAVVREGFNLIKRDVAGVTCEESTYRGKAVYRHRFLDIHSRESIVYYSDLNGTFKTSLEAAMDVIDVHLAEAMSKSLSDES